MLPAAGVVVYVLGRTTWAQLVDVQLSAASESVWSLAGRPGVGRQGR